MFKKKQNQKAQGSTAWTGDQNLKHNTIPTESLGKTTQYLLTVTYLCLFSCSGAATEIFCGGSPEQLLASYYASWILVYDIHQRGKHLVD